MNHIAIDWGVKESQICIRDEQGHIVREKRLKTERLASFLQKESPSRVIVETSNQSFAIADACLELGHEVRVVPSGLVRTLGVGSRGVKNDQRDAQILSEVSSRIDLPSVHIPSAQSRELRRLLASRAVMVRSRTRLISSVRGLLRSEGIELGAIGSRVFAKRLVERGPQPLPDILARMAAVLSELQVQIAATESEIEKLANAEPICQRLQTVPGVGPVTALCFFSCIDEVARFASAHQLQSYLGLVPGEHSSGQTQRRTGLSKAGNSMMRSIMIQAAWVAWRSRPNDPMVQWAKRIAERQTKFVAIAALARKMVGVLYAIWRDASRYNPALTADRIDEHGVVHSVQPCNRLLQ